MTCKAGIDIIDPRDCAACIFQGICDYDPTEYDSDLGYDVWADSEWRSTNCMDYKLSSCKACSNLT